jgi:A/G-specific adenine glycosylase
MKRRLHPVKFGHRFVRGSDIHFLRKALIDWYAASGRHFPWRRAGASRFHQVVSEILLQRTRAETVAAFWPTFLSRFPSWSSLAAANVEDIEAFLKPIGLSAQRAPRLKALATAIAARSGRFPSTRDEIEALPGVGQYVANAVLLFCFDKPHPLVDVNMARVLERFFGSRKLADIRYDPYLQQLAHAVISGKHPRHLNWAILDLAGKVCTITNPLCEQCPLLAHCIYGQKRKPNHGLKTKSSTRTRTNQRSHTRKPPKSSRRPDEL